MTRFICVLALSAIPMWASAQQFNYTFLELGVFEGEVEDADGEGFGFGGSMAVTEEFHAFAGYTNLEPDNANVDFSTTNVGIGFNTSLSTTTDLVLQAAYVRAEAEFGPFDSEVDGYSLGAGLRTWIGNGLELNGGLDYVDYGGNDDDVALNLGLLYSLNSSIALGVSGSWTDDPDSTILGLNARFYLGQ